MALSGTFYTNVSSYNRIQGEWTATQNTSANTSTVTLKTYWMSTSSQYGAVYSSATKNGYSTIEGVTDSYTGTAALSAGQKRLLNTQTRTITHNADGTFPDLDLFVSFSCEVTLAGTYYGTVTASGSYALNTIPRESTLASTPSFTAGNNFTVSVNRSSSSFRHEAVFYVLDSVGNYGGSIKTISLTSSQTSVSSAFTEAENTAIFNKLAGATSRGTRIRLYTYDGNTLIGDSTKDGTVTAPVASHPTSGYDAYQYTDELIDVPITRANSAFTHTVRFKLGTYTKTLTGITTQVNWTPTTAEENSLTAQMPNDSYMTGSIEVDTFYNGVQVRTTETRFFQFHVRNANPVFSGTVSYSDNNASTSTITGNNQYIIQNKSILSVTLSASSATPQKNATMSGYVFTVAGEGQTVPYTTSAITLNFGTIDATTNQTIVVEAVDSRGNRSAVTKIVTMVPYSTPALATTAARINGFEADTRINASGSFAPVKVAGITKNYITNLRYRTRVKNGVWGAYVTFPRTDSGTTFTGTQQTVVFDITQAYEVEVQAIDRFDTTTSIKSVGVGRPIFFIDDVLGSIAMNDFPVAPGTFLLNGQLTFAGNLYASTGEGGGAIFLNNGDVTGANGIWFNDQAGNSGEGLLFPKTGTAANSSNSAEYDNFYLRDGHMYMNNRDFLQITDGGASGSRVRIGAGGQTIIGAGESSQAIRDYVPDGPATEEMHIGSDNDVKIWAGGVSASSAAWRFAADGRIYRTHHLETNGYNTATIRANTATNSPMLIQTDTYSVAMGGASTAYLDLSFPVIFDVTPQAIHAQPTGSQSFGYVASVYNQTASGCRVYIRHMDASTSTSTISFYVTAIGRR